MTASARQGPATTTTTVFRAEQDPAERARAIALSILNGAPQSAGQLRNKLIARDVEPHVADMVIDRYREVGLLDDHAMAAAIVRTRHSERGQARRAIMVELQRKDFEPHVIEAALAQVSEQSERDTALEVGERRWAQLSGHTDQVRTRRVMGMLGRKGYAPSLVFDVVKHLQSADTDST